jgi:molybdate transport system substrate-binding protein
VRLAVALMAVTITALAAAGCTGDVDEANGSTDPDGEPVADTITVAAAADLRFAFEDLGVAFTERTDIAVTFSFGSSGQLREQIVNGAPFDVFASANADFFDDVIAAGRGVGETRLDYALGRLVVVAAPGKEPPSAIGGLADPSYRRVAVANPDHAPYGVAALQALRTAGIDEVLADRLVYGENISDTLRIVRSGNADAGIVALSLVTDDQHLLVPDDLHEPLRQALVVTSTGARGRAAQAFADFVTGPKGQEVLARYGFVVPDGAGAG